MAALRQSNVKKRAEKHFKGGKRMNLRFRTAILCALLAVIWIGGLPQTSARAIHPSDLRGSWTQTNPFLPASLAHTLR